MENRKVYILMGNALNLKGLPLDVDVQIHNGNGIMVEVEGEEEAIQNVLVNQVNNFVNVGFAFPEGKKSRMSGRNIFNDIIANGNVVISGGVSSSIINGRYISGDLEFTLPKVYVKVPIGTFLKVEASYQGKINIGDIEGRADVDVSGKSRVSLGSMKEVKINASGMGDVTVSSITDYLDIDISGKVNVTVNRYYGKMLDVNSSGMGKVIIREGQTDNLNVSLSGMGNVEFGGEAFEAQLRNSGMGTIKVSRVCGQVIERCSAMGRIEIVRRN